MSLFVFILAKSANPDKILHYFHLVFTVSQSICLQVYRMKKVEIVYYTGMS